MKQSPKLPAEKRLAQLIKAAQKVFAKNGYAGATTERIAREAKLTKGALYYHFKSKEDIFFAVIKDICCLHRKTIIRQFDTESDLKKVLENMIWAGIKLVKDTKYYTLEFWQKAYRVKRIRNYLDRENKELEDRLISYFMKHSSLNKRDSHSLLNMISVIFDGIVVRRVIFEKNIDLNNMGRDLIRMTKLYLEKK